MKEEIGKRIKLARQMAGLTRKQFAEKYQLNLYTLESWERGQNSVSVKMLDVFEKIFRDEGINITKDWILNGNTLEPFVDYSTNTLNTQDITSLAQDINYLKNDVHYLKEIKFFQESSINSLVTIILDEALSPYFNKGDYVGGISNIEMPLKAYIGKLCIIKIDTNKMITRKIVGFKNNQTVNVCSINHKAKLETPDYYATPYKEIAIITRHWLCSLLKK